MMKVKKLINFMLCSLLIAFSVACAPVRQPKDNPIFVGIAFYQNSSENNKWSVVKNNKSIINNMIETKNNKIVYNENPEFLFYIYSQNEINLETKDSDYISNTTRNAVTLTDQTLTFTLERLAEDTDVLIYFIYKDKDSYYLKFIKEQEHITSESETILINLSNNKFTQISLTLKINLSVT